MYKEKDYVECICKRRFKSLITPTHIRVCIECKKQGITKPTELTKRFGIVTKSKSLLEKQADRMKEYNNSLDYKTKLLRVGVMNESLKSNPNRKEILSKRNSKSMSTRWKSSEWKRHMEISGKTSRGKQLQIYANNPDKYNNWRANLTTSMQGVEVRELLSNHAIDRVLKGGIFNKGTPNKLEQYFLSVIGEAKIQFSDHIKVYCYINENGKRVVMTPDFMVVGKPKVIELFGDYWHKGEDTSFRISAWKKIGFECLVLWEHEVRQSTKEDLQNIVDKYISSGVSTSA